MSSEITMTSSRPYMIRGMHDWIVDNGLTPYLMVNVLDDGVQVPANHVQDGRIVLNVSPRAVQNYYQDNEWILFNARFDGQPVDINIPVRAVLAVYARENGQGMMFDPEEEFVVARPAVHQSAPTTGSKPAAAGRPHLEIVK